MDNKKINRKGQVSITVIVMTMLVAFAVMFAGMNFITNGVNEYNVTMTDTQEQAFIQLNDSQEDLTTEIEDIRDSTSTLELQSGFAFWNAFKGLGNILLLPLNLINIATNSVAAIFLGTDNALPLWVQTLLTTAVIALIVLVIVSALTGGNNKI